VKRFLRLCVIPIGLAVGASSFIHPYGPVKTTRSNASLIAGAAATPEVTGILERSCQNCHSDRTDWPWYSYAAPLSWLIEGDVHNGRSHMNLSDWGAYTEERKVELLTKMGVEVRNHRMPLPKYLKLHPEATLSVDDEARIYAWAQSERRRLKASIRSRSEASPD
jgi:Haem-binding domain